jgi:hypothetical protein
MYVGNCKCTKTGIPLVGVGPNHIALDSMDEKRIGFSPGAAGDRRAGLHDGDGESGDAIASGVAKVRQVQMPGQKEIDPATGEALHG